MCTKEQQVLNNSSIILCMLTCMYVPFTLWYLITFLQGIQQQNSPIHQSSIPPFIHSQWSFGKVSGKVLLITY